MNQLNIFMKKMFLRATVLLFLVLSFTLSQISCTTSVKAESEWLKMDEIIKNMIIPEFRDADYLITDFGAVDDGITDSGEAIKAAIEKCNSEGGGRVVVPNGKFFTGPIYIKSNVNLHLEDNAVLLFSTNPDDYYPLVHSRWEGVDAMNYCPLIYAFGETNIAITGKGTLDGQATSKNWWPWKGRKAFGWKEGMPNQTDEGNRQALFDMAENGVPVEERIFGNGHYLRPQFLQPYNCQNVLIEGVKIINSPMWIIHPVLCTNVTISDVYVDCSGPNTDGCDPESCVNVWIKDSYFKTGDDCIALKSGRNAEGRRINVPSENVVIQNCVTQNGHAGVAIGSEISGGAKNVFIENCKFNNPMWPIRFKTSSNRGGTSENIYFRNIEVDKARNESVVFTMLYEDKGDYMPTIKNVVIENLTVHEGGKVGIVMEAYEESPIQDVYFKNVNIENAVVPMELTNIDGITFEDTFINGEKIVNK